MGAAPLRMEVFSTGQWAGMDWTPADLDQMAQNFHALSGFIKPPLKLGHTDKQILAQKDGQPALGWVERLERIGTKLVATVHDVPQVLRDMIGARKYRRVSAEIYPKYELTNAEKTLKTGVTGKVLSAIALLGADIPEVKDLGDLHALLATEGIEATLIDAPLEVVLHEDDAAPLSVQQIHASPQIAPSSTTRSPRMADELKTVQDQLAMLLSEREAEKAEKQKLEDSLATLAADRKADQERIKALSEDAAKAREREARVQAALRHTEAVRFAEARLVKGNCRLTSAAKPVVIALHEKLAAMEGPLVLASEGAALSLFAEKETAIDLTATDLLERLIAALPEQSHMTKTHSVQTDGDAPQTFNDAVAIIAAEMKLDLQKPDDLATATIKVTKDKRFVDLAPKYGGAALYGN